ncbi:MAG: hypothetical protein RMX96_08770 [Nostoc sp. ChiSLP02]|nr:hypothetical protein [Nostoc sp. DedSLP05]MDZ8101795.1 hypothetical protein [Nostoc sp. DedSLP01]MDZ8184931.1 hypothetical protein [Nostoc sp. ChiSLP02]
MSKINFSLPIWLKQHRTIAGVILLAIAITSCNNAKSQLASANSPSVTNQIASSPPPSPASPTQNAADTKPEQEAVQVIREYYNAIARQDYKQAYSAWEGDGAASKQSFEQFKQGFANTASVAAEIGEPGRLDAAAGSLYIEIPVTITAVTINGTPERFHGSYVLRRVNQVPGSTPEQQRWHIYSANITPANSAQPRK